jgi:hypothetical protein
VELEHGTTLRRDLNVTHNEPLVTLRIAMAHLEEFPDYYSRHEEMEKQAERYWDEHEEEKKILEKDIDAIIKATAP